MSSSLQLFVCITGRRSWNGTGGATAIQDSSLIKKVKQNLLAKGTVLLPVKAFTYAVCASMSNIYETRNAGAHRFHSMNAGVVSSHAHSNAVLLPPTGCEMKYYWGDFSAFPKISCSCVPVCPDMEQVVLVDLGMSPGSSGKHICSLNVPGRTDRNVSEAFYFHTRYIRTFSVYRNEPCVTLMWCVWRHPCSQASRCFRVYLTLFMIYFKDYCIFQALDSTLVFRGWWVVSHTRNCSSCFGYLIATDSVLISCRPCFPNR